MANSDFTYGMGGNYGNPGTPTTDPSGMTLKPISAQVKPTDTSTSGGSTNTSDWAEWLNLINGIAKSQQKPKFVQPPWAPKQEGLFDYGMQRVMSLPHTGEALAPYAMARASENNPIDIGALKAGKVGYTPTGGMNQADLVRNMTPPGGGAGGGVPAPPSSTPPPAGSGGGTTPGAGGGANDPFATLPDPGASGNTGFGGHSASDILQKGIDYINQHGAGKAAGMTSGAIAAFLGMPGLIATGLGKVITALWDRYMKGDMSAQDIANFVAKGNEAGGIAGMAPPDPSKPSPKEYDPNDPSTWNASPNYGPGSSKVDYRNQDTTATGNPMASGVPQEAMGWSTVQRPGTRGAGRQAI